MSELACSRKDSFPAGRPVWIRFLTFFCDSSLVMTMKVTVFLLGYPGSLGLGDDLLYGDFCKVYQPVSFREMHIDSES